MSDEEVLPCPRCGGGVKALLCQNPLCGIAWTSDRSYEAECVARDLAGTRALQMDKDWLPSGAQSSGLENELKSLVYLVRLETVRDVDKALTVAIEGRDTDEYRALGASKAKIERDVLVRFRDWLKELEKAAQENI